MDFLIFFYILVVAITTTWAKKVSPWIKKRKFYWILFFEATESRRVNIGPRTTPEFIVQARRSHFVRRWLVDRAAEIDLVVLTIGMTFILPVKLLTFSIGALLTVILLAVDATCGTRFRDQLLRQLKHFKQA